MSDDNLSIQGTLAETTVPDLFRTILRSNETAVLSLQAIGRNDTIFWVDGKVVSASSSDPDMGLAETLLRSGELDINQYNQVMDKVLVPRKIAATLVELGYLKPEELSRAVEKQVNAIVLNALAYKTGSYTIEFTPEFPEGTINQQLPTDRLILDGVRRIDQWSLITRGVGRLERMLRQVPGSDTRTFQLELSDEENQIFNLVSEPQTVEQICAHSYLSNFQTLRTVWALLAVNLIEDTETSTVDQKRAAIETEYEMEALVEKYNGVYQQIFNLLFQKIGDHVYDFTDRVVLHLSPDRLPYLSGMSFVNEGRVDFDQLLNNLHASGSSDHGEIIRNVLDQLLYGWVVEVRTEFGGALDQEISRLADPLRG